MLCLFRADAKQLPIHRQSKGEDSAVETIALLFALRPAVASRFEGPELVHAFPSSASQLAALGVIMAGGIRSSQLSAVFQLPMDSPYSALCYSAFSVHVDHFRLSHSAICMHSASSFPVSSTSDLDGKPIEASGGLTVPWMTNDDARSVKISGAHAFTSPNASPLAETDVAHCPDIENVPSAVLSTTHTALFSRVCL